MVQKNNILIPVNLLALFLFSGMLVSVWYGTDLMEIDRWISCHMFNMRMEWLSPLVKWVTDLNGFLGAAVFSLTVAAVFVRKQWYQEIGFYLASTLGAAGLFSGVKYIVKRARPDMAIIEAGGFSFPSGHTTMATAMAFALYFILKEKTENREIHILLLAMAAGWSVLIASTRIYLGVHWFTDVLGGFGLGLWWVTLLKMLYAAR